jgi:hypothetical protein
MRWVVAWDNVFAVVIDDEDAHRVSTDGCQLNTAPEVALAAREYQQRDSLNLGADGTVRAFQGLIWRQSKNQRVSPS